MGRLRVRFTTPQPVAQVMSADALVSEVVVETDRLALLRGDGIQLSVDPDAVAWVRHESDDGDPSEDGVSRERPANEGRPWTDEEIQLLRQEWESGVRKTRDLAELHGRTAGAIRSRLKVLGLA